MEHVHPPNTAPHRRAPRAGVLRSAAGACFSASGPRIVGFRPFAAALRTLRRPRLAGEARLDASDGARPLHPARVASEKLWSAPDGAPRPNLKLILLKADSGRLWVRATMTETDAWSRSILLPSW